MMRNASRIALLLMVPAVSLVPAHAAFAQGGPTNCTVTTFATQPLPTKAITIAAEDAGTVVIKPDPTGLKIGKVVANTGWSKSVGLKVGQEVDVDFQSGNVRKKFKAAGTAAYYGFLQVEVDTCM
jgi:lipopolysaccharide export system protein LptA